MEAVLERLRTAQRVAVVPPRPPKPAAWGDTVAGGEASVAFSIFRLTDPPKRTSLQRVLFSSRAMTIDAAVSVIENTTGTSPAVFQTGDVDPMQEEANNCSYIRIRVSSAGLPMQLDSATRSSDRHIVVHGWVTTLAGNSSVVATCTTAGTLYVHTLAGSLIVPPVALGEPPHLLECSLDSHVAVITRGGRVRVWDVRHRRAVFGGSTHLSVKRLLLRASPPARPQIVPSPEKRHHHHHHIIEKQQTAQQQVLLGILSLHIATTGAPVIALSDGSCYAASPALGEWCVVQPPSSVQLLCRQEFASTLLPQLSSSGAPDAMAQSQRSAATATPIPVPTAELLAAGGTSLGALRSLLGLQSSLVVADMLASTNEYHRAFAAYVRKLADSGDELRVRDLCTSLLGPPNRADTTAQQRAHLAHRPFNAASSGVTDLFSTADAAGASGEAPVSATAGADSTLCSCAWQPSLLAGKVSKWRLLETALVLLAKGNPQLQRTVVEFQEQLDSAEKASQQAGSASGTPDAVQRLVDALLQNTTAAVQLKSKPKQQAKPQPQLPSTVVEPPATVEPLPMDECDTKEEAVVTKPTVEPQPEAMEAEPVLEPRATVESKGGDKATGKPSDVEQSESESSSEEDATTAAEDVEEEESEAGGEEAEEEAEKEEEEEVEEEDSLEESEAEEASDEPDGGFCKSAAPAPK
eukprot:TRINITY_DN3146_c0_g1_i5.p1 TRINITY_DN3146_c0_g1~~TRINITY_DN3146_c0_g1_i5.p1  ORF type:complete len:694 (+),score=167.95 TRINITY_DN3146_c0_g1_i5:1768-3849(+)